MKRIVCIFCCLLCSLFFIGCNDTENYDTFVTNLRQEIYYGESENYTLYGAYGFNKLDDGNTEYILSLKLLNKETANETYIAKVTYNGLAYEEKFNFNPVKSSLIADMPILDFKEKTFNVIIRCAEKEETITLNSLIPNGTLSYKDALKCLWKNQPTLINSYYDGEIFTASITQRITVKNGKAYWYFALKKDNDVKALLLDGITGEVLAIREIF